MQVKGVTSMNLKQIVMRVAILAACTLGPATLSAHAQGMGGGMGQMTPEQRSARQLEMMKTRLNLSEDQTTKVKDFMAERDKKMADLRSSGGAMETMRPKMMEIQKDYSDKVKGILTDDQKKTYEEIQSQMRGGGRPGPPPQQ